jgi:hypothetical protein
MSERCLANQTPFEPFDVCEMNCQDAWTNGLNAIPTPNNDKAESIHYEAVEISTAWREDAEPDERLCFGRRVNSETGDELGFISGAFRCMRE